MSRLLYLVICLTVILPQLQAQEPESSAPASAMTLEACLDFGLTHNPQARKALKDREIAEARVGQATSLVLPNLSVDANYTRLDEVDTFDLGNGPIPVGSEDSYNVNAGVSQLLYDGGRIGAALRAASLTRKLAADGYSQTANRLIRDIRVAFYDLLLAQATVAVQEESYRQIESLLEQTRQRHAAGAASDFDLLTAKVRLANEAPRNIAARNDAELAAAAFATLLNSPTPVTITGELAQVDITMTETQMLERALQNRPIIQASLVQLDLARESIVNARSASLPEVRAFFNYTGANETDFGSAEDDWEWGWTTGVTLNWNFWDGNLTRQTVRERKLDRAKLEDDHEAITEQVRLEVRQAWLQLQNARQALAASRDSVKLAEEALRIAKARNAAGLATYLEFTDANLALSTARLARLQSLRAHAVAIAEIYYACAMDEDRLIPNNNEPKEENETTKATSQI